MKAVHSLEIAYSCFLSMFEGYGFSYFTDPSGGLNIGYIKPIGAEEIFQFSRRASKGSFGEFGYFISGLMYHSLRTLGHREFFISTQGFVEKPPRFIGKKFRNNSMVSLEIDGDVGNRLGYKAKNLEIIVKGNAGTNIGEEAENCRIQIYGPCCQENLSNSIGEGTEIFFSPDPGLSDPVQVWPRRQD